MNYGYCVAAYQPDAFTGAKYLFLYLSLHIPNPFEEHVKKKAKNSLRGSKGRIVHPMVSSVTKPRMAVNNAYFTEFRPLVPHKLMGSLTEISDQRIHFHIQKQSLDCMISINGHALIASKNSPMDVPDDAEYVSSNFNQQPAS